ncbi:MULTISPECIES: response regulator transcription factor [Chryseobacterium]|uniref:DNA-binding NarL/FixJ family response regulator n=1 Tax=Chryseobacterium camelliae TaxID=1265445 RepID=A0ABU0TE39_9FLAO|nr:MULTISPECIES: response regulator transcription factor [Chryseobacterium]MDT3406997.1 DNA-binding NarL/FixJ family response regulator [Pseudacidovorax intermedius]MDQ1095211.1 DNA-binding NarL/FixJ family response regulator [Chryseobacterium camelliae]MDQ1099149.1 DNA-binding NarL/FixJ family response regulator [Chryseobacterium sp. SORGH_AS_1048]MDR6086498.1 DNA-binding NarL/FixJ family response regulator [Chryseobacterium sp. SORGH_AS_0909]MDR6130869.1 DNA-binding NarL/FixJ family response
MSKKILIADDHHIVLEGTTIVLESRIPDVIIDQAEDYPEAYEKICGEKYDMIILDINMPESKNKKMISEIMEADPDIKILVFSAYEDSVAIQYIREGAHGYVNKLSKIDELVDAVNKIFSEGYYYSTNIVNQLLISSIRNIPLNPLDALSKREYEIFRLMAKGHGNLEISNLMNIQMPTISTYKKRIYVKLKTANIADLIALYQKYC